MWKTDSNTEVARRVSLNNPIWLLSLIIGGLGFIGITIISGGTDARTAEPTISKTKDKSPSTQQAISLQRADLDNVYSRNCSSCHGADGTGNQVRKKLPTIPDFTSLDWQISLSDREITHKIETGGDLMPAYHEKLPQRKIAGLTIYVRAFAVASNVGAAKSKSEKPLTEVNSPETLPTPSRPTAVAKSNSQKAANQPVPEPAASILYRKSCQTCHGKDGKGTQTRADTPTIPDFTNGDWQQRVNAARLSASILEGKGTLMPSFRGKISAEQAQDLAAYVRAFGPGQTSTTEIPASDFDKRFRELENQWKEQDRQLKELPKPQPKP